MFNDTHERARHVIQQIELFADKFNLILMDPWGGPTDFSKHFKWKNIF